MNKSIIIEYVGKVNYKQNEYNLIIDLLEKSYTDFDNFLFVVIDNVKWDKYPLSLHLGDWAEEKKLFFVDEWIWLNFDNKKINNYDSVYKSILWFAKNTNTIFY